MWPNVGRAHDARIARQADRTLQGDCMTAVSSNDSAFRSADGIRQDALAVARDTLDHKAWQQRRNRHDDRRVGPAARAALILFLLVVLARPALGPTPPI